MPPAAKRPRVSFSLVQGVLKIECANVSTNVRGWGSGEVEVGGRKWSATIFKKALEGDDDGHKSLCCDLGCDDDTPIDVDIEYVAIGDSGNHTKKISATFLNGCDNSNMGRFFLDPEYLHEEALGIVKNDTIVVEIRISAKDSRAASPMDFDSGIDFTNAFDPRHDVAFIIGDERIYAGKQILSLYSPVFTAMFYGELREENDIPLLDIDRDDFLEFLCFVYPSRQVITGNNVNNLLKLADRYQVKLITDLAEEYLIKSAEDLSTKLHIAEQYRLTKLKDHCFNRITTDDFRTIKESSLYDVMSDSLKIALFEKLINIAT